MIAVTGATGQLGRLVIAALLEKGVKADQIIALARRPEKAADLEQDGVQVRDFDYTQPEAMVIGLEGVSKLLLISSNELGQRAAQHQAVIDAAKQAGVRWLAYTSVLHATGSALGLAAEHEQTEQALAASGLPHVLLRNGWYNENHAAGVPAAVAHDALLGSAGEGRISSAARADYAEAAAVVLAGEGHEGKTYELAGDSSYTLTELAAEVSRQADKPVPYHNLSEAEYKAALIQAGLPEPVAELLANSDAAAAKGALFDDSKVLSKLIGRATTPVAESVALALRA
ncbi:SDR family oxidoreductase [Pseudomonas eucalypticola]|uniref:SDR family oxidoreductase n=1 Tax=Pseudomonas eucalypticola TaxID=2599595 RepID=A0A7D5H136_9PSED|nr:SDR family oxidoreductase [Pseudomonas eucalypticola]QKZ05205.1 SDR family oxidoreductase [Pseudomonas eucalypticola]